MATIAAPALDLRIQQIAAFARSASFETTTLRRHELDEIGGLAPAGTLIYVSAIPARPFEQQLETARQLKAAGFDPVPHVAARNFASRDELDTFLGRMQAATNATRALVIGGDRDPPAGGLGDALGAIDSGLFEYHGFREIGIAGYPDGHPRIAAADLAQALKRKLAAAADHGLRPCIVTQFSLSAAPILDWLAQLRAVGIDVPVRIGVAGPTSLKTLMRFAAICGVRASANSLIRNAGLLKNLLGPVTPDATIGPVAAASNRMGDVRLHLFSFGSLTACMRWAGAVAAGRIVLRGDGFQVT